MDRQKLMRALEARGKPAKLFGTKGWLGKPVKRERISFVLRWFYMSIRQKPDADGAVISPRHGAEWTCGKVEKNGNPILAANEEWAVPDKAQ